MVVELNVTVPGLEGACVSPQSPNGSITAKTGVRAQEEPAEMFQL